MHTSKAKRQRAREGLYNASVVPYGYQLVGDAQKPPIPVDVEKAAVLMIFELYATQRRSPQQIMTQVNEAGYRTRKGTRFSKDTISEILQNPFYMGKVAYKVKHGKYAEIFDGVHEPIVSPELWERCRQVRTLRQVSARAMQPVFRVYLLSNLARCDVCGRKLRCQHQRVGPYYREVSYERGFTDCPHHHISTRAELVDRQIHTIVSTLQLPPDWTQELEARIGDEEQLSELQLQRDRLEGQIQRLREMYLRGDFDGALEQYQAELGRLRRELESLPTFDQLEGLKAAVSLVSTLQTGWANATPTDQRDLLRLMLRDVTVDVTTGRVVTLQPQAVFIPIFRESVILVERDLGLFVPVWHPNEYIDVRAIPDLPTSTIQQTNPMAPPFLDDLPIRNDDDVRIIPGISHALELGRNADKSARMLVQIHLDTRPRLHDDVRRWPGVTTRAMMLEQILKHEPEQIDVLVTNLVLWDGITQAAEGFDIPRFIAQVKPIFAPGGVWYAVELDPASVPAHWVYTFFPEARNWVETHFANTYTLYNHFQASGFKMELKRQVFYQSISIQSMLTMAQARPTVLKAISEEAYRTGMRHLQETLEQKGDGEMMGSEIAIVELWAQKQ
jgi:hypothetical protein